MNAETLIEAARTKFDRKTEGLSDVVAEELGKIVAYNDGLRFADGKRVSRERAIAFLRSHGWSGSTQVDLDNVSRALGRHSFVWPSEACWEMYYLDAPPEIVDNLAERAETVVGGETYEHPTPDVLERGVLNSPLSDRDWNRVAGVRLGMQIALCPKCKHDEGLACAMHASRFDCLFGKA